VYCRHVHTDIVCHRCHLLSIYYFFIVIAVFLLLLLSTVWWIKILNKKNTLMVTWRISQLSLRFERKATPATRVHKWTHVKSWYKPKFYVACHVSTRHDSTRSTCRASRDERVEPCCSNMADDEQAIVLACTSLVVFMLLQSWYSVVSQCIDWFSLLCVCVF